MQLAGVSEASSNLPRGGCVPIDADQCSLPKILCVRKRRNEDRENTRVSYQFISRSSFLPKKIVPRNPWMGGVGRAEAGQSAGVALKCGCRASSPFPAQLLKQRSNFKGGLAVVPASGGCDSHQLALEKKWGGIHPLPCQGLRLTKRSTSFWFWLSLSSGCKSKTTAGNFIGIYIYLCTLFLQIIWDGQFL